MVLWVTGMNSISKGPISTRRPPGMTSRSVVDWRRPASSRRFFTSASVKRVPYTGTLRSRRMYGSAPMWSSWPCVRTMARTCARFCLRYVMPGITRWTPRSSDSGNIMPASMTMMSSPSRKAIMFMPNSPRPPSGMAVRDCAGLLKKELSPWCNRESYHSGGGSQSGDVERRRKGRSLGSLGMTLGGGARRPRRNQLAWPTAQKREPFEAPLEDRGKQGKQDSRTPKILVAASTARAEEVSDSHDYDGANRRGCKAIYEIVGVAHHAELCEKPTAQHPADQT